jgi:hypothetical protein
MVINDNKLPIQSIDQPIRPCFFLGLTFNEGKPWAYSAELADTTTSQKAVPAA